MSEEVDISETLVNLRLIRVYEIDRFIGSVAGKEFTCGVECQGFVCTRKVGHKGLCLAHTSDNGVCAIFRRDGTPVSAPRYRGVHDPIR